MIQGAAMDYFILYTFILVAVKLREQKNAWSAKHWCKFGVSAALLHVLSIQPLFLGIGIADGVLPGYSTLFLFPTFFLYTVFAMRELGRANVTSKFEEFLLELQIVVQRPPEGSPAPHTQTSHSTQQHSGKLSALQMTAVVEQLEREYEEKEKEKDSESRRNSRLGMQRGHKHQESKEEEGDVDMMTRQITSRMDVSDFKSKKSAYMDYISNKNIQKAMSLFNQGIIKHFQLPPNVIIATVVLALASSIGNSVVVWFSPCFVTSGCKD